MDHALSEVKAVLRVSHSKLDDLYVSSINECLADMKLKGVLDPDLSDDNVIASVKLYCQSLHGDPKYSEAFMQRYEKKRDGLVVAEGYGWNERKDSDE